MEKVWEIKDPDAYLSRKKSGARRGPPAADKDPAKAYRLSLLYWGGGQLYNDQIGKGAFFLITEVLLLVGVVLSTLNYDLLIQILGEHGISLSEAFLALEAVLFFSVFLWVMGAGDAYHNARKRTRTPFRGVKSRLAPPLASVVLPGWGQFLNGQQVKGSIFNGLAVLGIFSLLSVVLTYLAWPRLEASETRYLVEGIFAVCLIIAPFVPLLWVFGVFDALKVSLDELKKERLWERIKAAYYRGKNQGWIKGVFPQIKGAFLLVLLLTLLVIVVISWFPVRYYVELLKHADRVLSDRGLAIVPGLIERLLAWISSVSG